MKSFFSAIALCLLSVLIMPAMAFAADTFEISIQEPIQILIGLVFSAITALAVVGIVKFSESHKDTLTKLGIDEKHREVLQDAVAMGLNFAKNIVLDKAKGISNPAVKSELVAAASNYVLNRVPDAIEHFGITEEALKEMILARFDVNTGGDNAGEAKTVSQ
ncbi:MAG: hypothetical protein DI551_05255 [Micavibrio aeruginosavorus]|uniref:Holin n=1 Tax=Micavibrio aeruginosavorus TaxID=349221 RepID=A0A2W5PV48_9BACT|nr:MAG: hypothetical protein DI551_05255 [Micavibrio aeruginosavorus]